MPDTPNRRIRLISFMPLVVVLMGVLTYVAAFAVTATAPRVALVIAILALATAFSAAMLRDSRTHS